MAAIVARTAAPSAPSPPNGSLGNVDHAIPPIDHAVLKLQGLDDTDAPSSAKDLARRRRKKKSKDDSLGSNLRYLIVHHQLGLSLNFLILLGLTHLLFPTVRAYTTHFFHLANRVPESGRYIAGVEDIAYVACWIVVFTGMRDAAINYFLTPFARALGITQKGKLLRFAEQGWLLMYYSFFWALGMYFWVNSAYWFNFKELWTNWPYCREMDGLFKWYYLVQFAFWVQQIVVIHIEERRKDHYQMLTHHLVTCALLFTSYGYYETKAGNVILCIMDVVDIVFPLAKCLKYAGFQTACDVAFGVFMLVWVGARHVIYLMLCKSIYYDGPIMMRDFGCYDTVTGKQVSTNGGNKVLTHVLQPFTRPGGVSCYNDSIRFSFLGMLLFLQGITIMWFCMIVRVAIRVVRGQGADDSRSDEGDDEEEEEEEDEEVASEQEHHSMLNLAPKEEEVGVEGLNLHRRGGSPRLRMRKAESYTVTNGLSESSSRSGPVRKELLGRIGCDKPS